MQSDGPENCLLGHLSTTTTAAVSTSTTTTTTAALTSTTLATTVTTIITVNSFFVCFKLIYKRQALTWNRFWFDSGLK